MDVGTGTEDTGDSDTGVPFAGTAVIKGVKAGIYADNWYGRGKYYDDYFKNTGKRPRYYNKLTRKRIRW